MTALQALVADRLRAIDRNPFDAATRVGLERSFLNDILIGRKRSVRGDNLARLADALEMKTTELIEAIVNPTHTETSPDTDSVGSMVTERCAPGKAAWMDVSIIRSALMISLQGQGMSSQVAEMTAQLWIEDAKKRAASQNPRQNDSTSESDGQ